MVNNEPYIGRKNVEVKDVTNSNNNNVNNENVNNENVNNENVNNENIMFKDNNINNIENNNENADNDKDNDVTNTLWLTNPIILVDKNAITQLWPMENMTREEKINAITRLVILLTLIGFLFLNNIKILITGIIALLILLFTYYILNKNDNLNKIKETFSNEEMYEKVKHNFTNPTSLNPIMNILLPEIQDNPNRLEAAPSYNKAVKNSINEETKEFIVNNFDNNENIKKNLFNNQVDNFEFEQSMRQFYTTANTRVPNNQKEFARFCYGNMASCKDGDVEMCLKNSFENRGL
jgi:hypothetical protein